MATFPGEKLLIKLWETLADGGVGALLTPFQIARVEKAHSEARQYDMLLMAQTEKQIEEIKRGDLIIDFDSKRLISLSTNQKEEGSAMLQMQKLSSKIMTDAARKEINTAKAILHAEAELQNDEAEPSSKPMDRDWVHKWREFSSEVSSEELQSLWGKALAGELKMPGSFSLRTLDFMRNLSKIEAENISKLAPFTLGDLIFRGKNHEDDELKFDFFFKMQELGILSGVDANGVKIQISSGKVDKFRSVLIGLDKILLVESEDHDKKLSLPAYSITAIGKEIFKLGNFKINDVYIRKVAKYISDKGFKVTLGKINSMSEDKINFDPIDTFPSDST